MKRLSFSISFLLVVHFLYCQENSKEYQEIMGKWRSLYKAEKYKNAAIMLSSAVRNVDFKPSVSDLHKVAFCWTLAGEPDSAFSYLNIIARREPLAFNDFTTIVTDEDYTTLQNDIRWEPTITKIFNNARNSFYAISKEKMTNYQQYQAAIAWNLQNEIDSIHYYLNLIAQKNNKTGVINFNNLEDFNPSQAARWQRIVKDVFGNVAKTYSSRIWSGNWSNSTVDGYDAARNWAMAGEPDSSFLHLDRIVNTNYNVFTRHDLLIKDSAFTSLHKDKRWPIIEQTVKKNYTPMICGHTPRGKIIPLIATFDTAGYSLKGDGMESYKNGVDKVSSADGVAYNLQLSSTRVFEYSGNRKDLSPRYITLDLNSIIFGSGSVPQGIIKDNDFAIHVFYKLDTLAQPMLVHNLRDIPMGATIESDRTEIVFYLGGILHTLQMGPWALGYCNEYYSYKGRLNGIGTTRVLVKHNAESNYTISAPEGSIARLWRTQNLTAPIDMGLFKIGFLINLRKE